MNEADARRGYILKRLCEEHGFVFVACRGDKLIAAAQRGSLPPKADNDNRIQPWRA